jgi:hypothetical protein
MVVGAGVAAADVCKVKVANGSLQLRCDDDDNDVVVDQVVFGSGTFRIDSDDGTLFDTGSGPAAGPVFRDGVTRDVHVDLGGGQAVVGQCVASEQPTGRCPGDLVDVADARIPRDLKITSGFGRNELLVAGVEVGGHLKVENGSGGSESDCEDSSIGGDLRATNGDGFNEVKIDACEIGGSVMYSNLAGSTVLDIESETLIHRNVHVANGDGETHEIGVEESSILGSLRVRNGSAEEIEIEMEAEEGTRIWIGGDILVENGAADSHAFGLEGAEGEENFTVGGSIRIANGPGASEVALEKDVQVQGSLHHQSGDGFDEFAFEEGVEIQGDVRIAHGSGGSETVLEDSEIGGSLGVEAGEGEDVVELAEVEVGGATRVSTGADDDEVVVGDSSFAGSFGADGGSEVDTFEDAGGNDFQGGFGIENFEVTLP